VCSSDLFHGEEITFAVRAWTKGYDLYYPHRAVCYHRYTREKRTTHWHDNETWQYRDVMSQQRVRRLLGMEPPAGEDLGPYGLGSVRTLAQYEAFSGVDFKNMLFAARAWSGRFDSSPPVLHDTELPDDVAGPDILFVTAFRDLGRGRWRSFRRGSSLYLEWFAMMTALRNLPLVCYCEDELRRELPPGEYYVEAYNLDDTFHKAYYEREKEIAESPAFKKWIGERALNPEHQNPDYSMTTHCKVNFVRRAARQYPGCSHYIWIDFGAVREPLHPDTVFDWSRLLDDKIHMQAFGDPASFPSDPRELCRTSPDALSAALFVVPAEKIQWYESAYERELQRNHKLGIADDEQNIMLRLAQQYPDQITADRVEHWQGFLYDSIK
jgi:hypothetical protein